MSSSRWNVKDILDPNEAINYGSRLVGQDFAVLPTGIPSWDRCCMKSGGRGLPTGDYVILGAKSGTGKTQLLWHLLAQGAIHEMHPGLLTMEVQTHAVQRTFYSRISDTFGFTDFLPWKWEGGDVVAKTKSLAADVGKYSNGGSRSLTVCEHDGAPSLDAIVGMMEHLCDSGCRVIGVDYLQLIKASKYSNEGIADLATEVSEEVRRFAHSRNVLVIGLSQLNRWASREVDRPPVAQDLWGGTAMEANANQVALLDHSLLLRDDSRSHIIRTNLLIDKQREGPDKLEIPVEANFASGVWREGMPDEEEKWFRPSKDKKGKAKASAHDRLRSLPKPVPEPDPRERQVSERERQADAALRSVDKELADDLARAVATPEPEDVTPPSYAKQGPAWNPSQDEQDSFINSLEPDFGKKLKESI